MESLSFLNYCIVYYKVLNTGMRLKYWNKVWGRESTFYLRGVYLLSYLNYLLLNPSTYILYKTFFKYIKFVQSKCCGLKLFIKKVDYFTLLNLNG